MQPARGEIWWANLPAPVGSEPGYRRPVLVIQSDFFNRSQIHTVLVVAITGSLDRAKAAGNVMLPASVSGLEKDSVANVSQILTLDRRRLSESVAMLPYSWMEQVAAGLREVMEL